ncbi:MAG: hypothetical protein ABI036_03100 [Fibrobacteria bacterium]
MNSIGKGHRGSQGGKRLGAALILLGGIGSASALEVHEWGTFTTLSSSAGYGLSGLYVDATRLPAFVHGLPYFNYDTSAGWAPLERLRHVTVKMETPVLYFYADRETPVEVKVDFRGGTISQWYPQCYLGEANPTAPFVDFAKEPYPGHIAWKATVLAPGTSLPYATAASGMETAEWTAPRNTTANQLRGEQGEIEKFLFYRGLGNFASPLKLSFHEPDTLVVENTGDEDIPWGMVYERSGPELWYPGGISFQGPIPAHGKLRVARPEKFPQYGDANAPMDTLYNHLVLMGLTTQEARALLNTWYNGYFIEGGLKVFWILPRKQVDGILPLDIRPVPDKVVRVMVGRSEILPPEFEQGLYQAQADGSLAATYGSHRYYQAYLEFLSHGKDWHLTTSLGRSARVGRPAEAKGARAGWNPPGAGGWAAPWFSGDSHGRMNGKENGKENGRESEKSGAFDPRGRRIRPLYPLPGK